MINKPETFAGCIESNRKSLESFLIPTVLENGMAGWQCPQCDKQTNHKGHMKDHIEGVHYKMNYPCDICGSFLGSLSAIKKHIDVLVFLFHSPRNYGSQ